MLGQHDRAVAGAAAGDERAEGLREIAPTGEDVVVDLQQMARPTRVEMLRQDARLARLVAHDGARCATGRIVKVV